MSILINPMCRWAWTAIDAGRLEYIEGRWNPSHTLPHIDQIITRPFLVDPDTRQPVPVQVVDIQPHPDRENTLLIVVTRSEHH